MPCRIQYHLPIFSLLQPVEIPHAAYCGTDLGGSVFWGWLLWKPSNSLVSSFAAYLHCFAEMSTKCRIRAWVLRFYQCTWCQSGLLQWSDLWLHLWCSTAVALWDVTFGFDVYYGDFTLKNVFIFYETIIHKSIQVFFLTNIFSFCIISWDFVW